MAIPKLAFGQLAHLSTRTLFGVAAPSRVSQEDADRTLDLLLQYGVNHIDVAANYGDAELRIAPWLKRYPNLSWPKTLSVFIIAVKSPRIEWWQLHLSRDEVFGQDKGRANQSATQHDFE